MMEATRPTWFSACGSVGIPSDSGRWKGRCIRRSTIVLPAHPTIVLPAHPTIGTGPRLRPWDGSYPKLTARKVTGGGGPSSLGGPGLRAA